MHQAGTVTRPPPCGDMLETLVNDLYGLTVIAHKELPSYFDRNYHIHVMPEHSNSHIKEPLSKDGYVLKVLNSVDSARTVFNAPMHALTHHLHNHGIVCSLPLVNVNGNKTAKRRILAPETNQKDYSSDHYAVSLLRFIPGQVISNVPYTPSLLIRTGQYAGEMDRILQDFHDSYYDGHAGVFGTVNVPKLSEFLYAVKNGKDREVVETIVNDFKSDVIPQYNKMNKGIIHGDLNDQNIIVNTCGNDDRKPVYDIIGVIDFGEAAYTYIVFEVAITICYMMLESTVTDPLDVGGYILAGYTSVMALNDTEFDVLKVCIAGRLCQSLVMGAYMHELYPNNEYILTTSAKGWPILRKFWSTPKQDLYNRWKKIIEEYSQ